MVRDNPDIDAIVSVFAGKFRRYHCESWLQRITDIKTNALNLRDVLYVFLGFFQALVIVRRLKPQVVFLKGGFVGVPIGLAAALWRLPIVTHDSDALPGLANRLVSRWVSVHATAMAEDNYTYPKDKTKQVGVLVTEQYEPVTNNLQDSYREQLGIPKDAQYLMITGGSGGAEVINKAVVRLLPELLETMPSLWVTHQTGIGKKGVYGEFMHPRLQATELLKGMHTNSGAADVIVTRAGANTLAEFGIQGKACIVVPNPLLTSGHQIKNGDYLRINNAAIVLEEKDIANSEMLKETILELLDSANKRQSLGKNLRAITVPDAAKNLVELLLSVSKNE